MLIAPAVSVWGNWTHGDFTIIDLIAATTNAFNGALLARRPDHYKHFTIVGVILLAIAGGIAGGVSRDVLLNTIPAALSNPWYLIFCLLAASIALVIDFQAGEEFRDGLFQFATAFSLPWFAIAGAQAALDADLPYLAAVLLGVVGATAGRFFIDVSCGLPPKQFLRGEWFVGTAILSSIVYIICAEQGLSIWPATLIAAAVGIGFRLLALTKLWEEPEPWEPAEERAAEPARVSLGEELKKEGL
jgi:uncharacterized membrane protein YeiH